MNRIRRVSVRAGLLAGALVAVAALLWALWWQALAWGGEYALAAWFDAERERGRQAEHGEVEVSGFPLRLDFRVAEIALADPRAGWSWRLPELRAGIRAASPTTLEAHLPKTHRIALEGESFAIANERMILGLSLAPGPALALRRGAVDAADVALNARSGWNASARSLTARIERETGDGYAITLSAAGIGVSRPLLLLIDPGGFLDLPGGEIDGEIDRIGLDATAIFRAPLDRFALRGGRPALDSVTIRNAELAWGDLRVKARGRVRADADGHAAGRIDVDVRGWSGKTGIAGEAARGIGNRIADDIEDNILGGILGGIADEVFGGGLGEITGKIAEGIAGGAGSLAEPLSPLEERLRALVASGGGDFDLTLELGGGRIRLGPLDIGKAPRLAPDTDPPN